MSTALLVIDAQEIYTNPDSDMYCPDAEQTLNRINEIIVHCVGLDEGAKSTYGWYLDQVNSSSDA